MDLHPFPSFFASAPSPCVSVTLRVLAHQCQPCFDSIELLLDHLPKGLFFPFTFPQIGSYSLNPSIYAIHNACIPCCTNPIGTVCRKATREEFQFNRSQQAVLFQALLLSIGGNNILHCSYLIYVYSSLHLGWKFYNIVPSYLYPQSSAFPLL